jgi:predicted permease
VGVQVALAVTLLSGAALLVRSIAELGRVSPGFEASRVLTFRMSGSYAETTDYPAMTRRIDRTLDFLRTIPGVEASATTITLPGIPGATLQSEMKFAEGSADSEARMVVNSRVVSSGYFAAMGIPLLSGESCPTQARSAAQGDVLVNRIFVNTYMAGLPAIGRHLQGQGNAPAGRIRGIVGDTRERGLQWEPGPTVYMCSSAPGPSPFLLVRTSGEPSAMIPVIRRKLREIEPLRSVFDFAPLQERLDEAFSENRLRTALLVIFAAAAMLLARAGLYSSLSYLVTVRRKEVGLRIALGAPRGNIVNQFLKQGVKLALSASAVGLVLALALPRLLAGMLYGVSPSDPLTLSTVMVLILAVCSAASLIPAARAARFEPMTVLREE